MFMWSKRFNRIYTLSDRDEHKATFNNNLIAEKRIANVFGNGTCGFRIFVLTSSTGYVFSLKHCLKFLFPDSGQF